jgi:hypothetical protein
MSHDDLAARVEAELRAQGLSRTVVDPYVLRQVAGLLGTDDPNQRARRLAEARRELAEVEVRMSLLDAGDDDSASPSSAPNEEE